MYIKHIVWRFAKCKPEEFKLLDVRHNVMKSLILGDCDHLINFILFGDETENKNGCGSKEKKGKEKDQKKFETRHIPRNGLWPGEKFLEDDDLDVDKRKDNWLNHSEKIMINNNVELAIYRYKGRF